MSVCGAGIVNAMAATDDSTDDYCERCDLPLSQCIHGRPVPEPVAAPPAPRAAKPRTRTPAASSAPVTTSRPVARRWTPPEVLEPLIVDVLTEAGGELAADDVLGAVEAVIGDGFRPGDTERTPEGELRWHFAARRARQSLIRQGVMVKAGPGVWKLT